MAIKEETMEPLYKYISNIMDDKNIELIPIGRGVNNIVYKFLANGQNYAIKIKERGLHDFFEPEATALKLLNGFYAPKLVFYEDGAAFAHKFIIMEYVRGNQIQDFGMAQVNRLLQLISNVHEKTAKQNIEPLSFHDEMDKYLKEKCYSNLNEISSIPYSNPDKTKSMCDKLLSICKKDSAKGNSNICLIHGDLNHTNILSLANRNEWKFVDWELSRYSNCETEIASIIWAYGNSMEMINNLFDNQIVKADFDRIKLLTLARGLDVVTWRTKWIHSQKFSAEEECRHLQEVEEDWLKIDILSGIVGS